MNKENSLSQNALLEDDFRAPITDCIAYGKVRNIHSFTGLIFETSNRLSVFDRVIKEDVPLKGAMLNCISQFNKQLLNEKGFNTDYIPVPDEFFKSAGFDHVGTLCYSACLSMIPIEFVVRGYLVGSAYKAYKNGMPYCGFIFPKGLKEGDKLPEPIITPTTKEETGHDRPINKEQCIDIVAKWLMELGFVADSDEIAAEHQDSYPLFLRLFDDVIDDDDLLFADIYGLEKEFDYDDNEEAYDDVDVLDVVDDVDDVDIDDYSDDDEDNNWKWTKARCILARLMAKEYVENAYQDSLDAFDFLSKRCEEKGIIFVDTKFEFGIDSNDNVVLADEVGTPDSSRFAPKDVYERTHKLVSLDKQIVRDYCSSIGFTGDESQFVPKLPNELWQQVTDTYVHLAEVLCGKEFVEKYKKNA